MSSNGQNNSENGNETFESEFAESGVDIQDEKEELKSDEVYCTSCGAAIKQEAVICPECGVRQIDEDQSNSSQPDMQQTNEGLNSSPPSIPDGRVYELQRVARKSPGVAVALSLLLTPASYWYVGRTGLALVNLLTFNYLLLGFVIVPVHSYMIIKNAREELTRHREGW